MQNYIFIKFYYTVSNPGPALTKTQIKVEDLLEEEFENKEVKVFLHFINASWGAYYSDYVEVEHTFPLSDNNKKTIFEILKTHITFSEGEYEEEDIDLYADIYNERSFLKYCIFRKITESNFYSYNEEL